MSLNSARGRARDAQRYNDLRQLFTAMTLYYDTRTTTPQYPEMFDDTHKYVSDAAPGWWVGIVGSNRFFPTPLKDPKIGEASAYPFAKQIDTNPNDTFDDKLQHYCVYTKLEGANNYLIVTERGLSSKEVPSTGIGMIIRMFVFVILICVPMLQVVQVVSCLIYFYYTINFNMPKQNPSGIILLIVIVGVAVVLAATFVFNYYRT